MHDEKENHQLNGGQQEGKQQKENTHMDIHMVDA